MHVHSCRLYCCVVHATESGTCGARRPIGRYSGVVSQASQRPSCSTIAQASCSGAPAGARLLYPRSAKKTPTGLLHPLVASTACYKLVQRAVKLTRPINQPAVLFVRQGARRCAPSPNFRSSTALLSKLGPPHVRRPFPCDRLRRAAASELCTLHMS